MRPLTMLPSLKSRMDFAIRSFMAEAADQARDLAAAHPEYPALLYNLACCESLAGRKADAIEHLRLALERSDKVRPYLAGDSDLDPLREEQEFQALLAG